jgi:hypothetical protein
MDVVTLTPRELRIIADHVERLTKARVVNTQLGIDTTPDVLVADFPNGFTATVTWMQGQHSDDPRRRQRIARHARHRDCYQLDAATLTPTVTARPVAQVSGTPAAHINAAVVDHMAKVARAGRERLHTA